MEATNGQNIKKYLFLRMVGTLINHGGNVGEINPESLEAFYLMQKELDCETILLDCSSEQFFNMVGKDSDFKIIGEVMTQESVSIVTPYGDSVEPMIAPMGLLIDNWIETYIKRPYRRFPEEATNYELWDKPTPENGLEQPIFLGMKTLEEGKDFEYRIVGDITGLLAEQKDKNIVINYEIGLNRKNIKQIILSF